MSYVIAMLIALWLGFLVGRQKRWSHWHGPVGAVITVPIAMWLGFDEVLSVLVAIGLGGGFLITRATY